MRWIPAAFMKVVTPGVLVTLVLAACGTVGDADPHVIDTRTGEAPICKDFASVVEDTVRDDAQEVTRGLRNLARDLQALAQGRSPEAANDQFDGSGPRIYVKLVDFERAFGGAHDPRYVHERLRYDIWDLFADHGFEWVHDEEVRGRENHAAHGVLRYVDAPLGPGNLGAVLLTYGGHSYWTGFADDSEVSARVVLSVAYAGRMSGRVDWEDTLETRLLADKEYCTLYYIYRDLLGREDNSVEAIYALIMQTVRDRVLPEIIEQARGDGF